MRYRPKGTAGDAGRDGGSRAVPVECREGRPPGAGSILEIQDARPAEPWLAVARRERSLVKAFAKAAQKDTEGSVHLFGSGRFRAFEFRLDSAFQGGV